MSEATKYESFEAAIAAVRDAREFQAKKWPNTQLENAGGRPFEEWVLLMRKYLRKLEDVYGDTPGMIPDTTEPDDASGGPQWVPNVEGRKRIKKYAAIVANLSMWAVQSAMDGADTACRPSNCPQCREEQLHKELCVGYSEDQHHPVCPRWRQQ